MEGRQCEDTGRTPSIRIPEASRSEGRGVKQRVSIALRRNQPCSTLISDAQPLVCETVSSCCLSHLV